MLLFLIRIFRLSISGQRDIKREREQMDGWMNKGKGEEKSQKENVWMND